MYLRTIKRKNKDGSVVEYVQLANNVWNKDKGYAQAQVIHSFGRSDQLDLDVLRRLIKSMSRLLDPEDRAKIEHCDDDLKIVSSKPAGGAYLLKALWDRLHIDDCLKKALKKRSFSAPIAEALFAMVANRALAPSSKLAIEQWAAEEVHLDLRNSRPMVNQRISVMICRKLPLALP